MFSKLHYDLTSFFQHFYVIMELLKILFNFKTDITYDQQLNAEYLRCWSFFCIAQLLPRKIFTKNFFAHFVFFSSTQGSLWIIIGTLRLMNPKPKTLYALETFYHTWKKMKKKQRTPSRRLTWKIKSLVLFVTKCIDWQLVTYRLRRLKTDFIHNPISHIDPQLKVANFIQWRKNLL